MDHGIRWQDVGMPVPEMGDQQWQRHEGCAQQPLDFEKASGADHEHGSIHIVLGVDFIDRCQQAADGKCHDPCQHKFFLQKKCKNLRWQEIPLRVRSARYQETLVLIQQEGEACLRN